MWSRNPNMLHYGHHSLTEHLLSFQARSEAHSPFLSTATPALDSLSAHFENPLPGLIKGHSTDTHSVENSNHLQHDGMVFKNVC